jgi:hypothetical protein
MPACLGIAYRQQSWHMLSRMINFLERSRLDAVEHSREHRLRRLPDDSKDGDGDEKSDDGISERETHPNADCPYDDREASQSVGSGMVTVGD